jgi:hypothetical protein
MLIDQDDSNIFPTCKALERRFDGCSFRFIVDDEKVLFRFGAGSDMLCTCVRQAEHLIWRRLSWLWIQESRETVAFHPPGPTYTDACEQEARYRVLYVCTYVRVNAIFPHLEA